MKTLLSISVFVVFTIISHACNSSDVNQARISEDYPGYKVTKSGLLYNFHVKADGKTARVGDVLTFDLVYSDENGNILMDTRPGGHPSVLELIDSEYQGDIYEGLRMMSVGDSAGFILEADEFFQVTAKIPEGGYEFIEPGSKLFVEIKMHNIQTQEEFEEELMKNMEKQREEQNIAYMKEEEKLNEYLKANDINVEPRNSGLIYIEKESGDGPKVKPGQDVRVHYRGMFMDGTVFDSSYERGDPISFAVGHNQVIQGWDEGILLMNVGGKARLIIPSYLAYGAQGAGNVIPPFSTLIFDVEIVEAN